MDEKNLPEIYKPKLLSPESQKSEFLASFDNPDKQGAISEFHALGQHILSQIAPFSPLEIADSSPPLDVETKQAQATRSLMEAQQKQQLIHDTQKQNFQAKQPTIPELPSGFPEFTLPSFDADKQRLKAKKQEIEGRCEQTKADILKSMENMMRLFNDNQ